MKVRIFVLLGLIGILTYYTSIDLQFEVTSLPDSVLATIEPDYEEDYDEDSDTAGDEDSSVENTITSIP